MFIIDSEEDAKRLVDLYRVDLIWPIGETGGVKDFSKKFPYLRQDFLHNSLFVYGRSGQNRAQVLDINNAMVHFSDRPEWQALKARGVRLYSWEPNDVLADVLLVHFGGFPKTEVTGLDYRSKLV